MPGHVFVVSEWLPKTGQETEFWDCCKELMAQTRNTEEGCIRAHVTRQIPHPGSPGKTKFTVILLQEYKSVEAYTAHCDSQYVKNFFKNRMEHLVEDWRCRLFEESEDYPWR